MAISTTAEDELKNRARRTFSAVSRFHPALVTLHWFLAALIIADLSLGSLILAHTPNDLPRKLEGLRSHMAGGLVILFLMTSRLAIRLSTRVPEPAPTGRKALDRLAELSHRMLYVAVFMMTLSGLGLALEANLPAIVFAHQGRLPPSLWAYPLRPVHFLASRLLMGLIALHLAGAAFHILVRKDGLLSRMWFGRRVERLAASQTSAPMCKEAAMPLSQRLSPYVSRVIVLLAAALLTLIASRSLMDARGAALREQIQLNSPNAAVVANIGFGAFPLALAIVLALSSLSRRTAVLGVVLVEVVMVTLLAVRLISIQAFGGLEQARAPITGETVFAVLALVALGLDWSARRAAART